MQQPVVRVPEWFADRRDAGRYLAAAFADSLAPASSCCALPRSGRCRCAFEVALALHAPLDVFEVRKLGVPGHEELAMGAIASGGIIHLSEQTIRSLRISRAEIERVVDRERAELERRERLYRDGRPRPAVVGKTVLLVDDGLATGSTMRAAVDALRRRGPAAVIVAVPVAPRAVCRDLSTEADGVVCPLMPGRSAALEHGTRTSTKSATTKCAARCSTAAAERRL